MRHVVIVGGGFAGLKAAKVLGKSKDMKVTLIDRTNHHLFQPLLYQVATSGLSQSDIAVPIRSILSGFKNIYILQGTVEDIDFKSQKIKTNFSEISYDYLILCCGAKHAYFGHDEWEPFAPGLKTLEQAVEIRRRILTAFEEAERQTDVSKRKKNLTFAVVGGGPTGVELAGAIGEMSRFALSKDFRNIDPKLTRVILIEAGSRILASFSEEQSSIATRDLENLGVQVWTSSKVTKISSEGIEIGSERIEAGTVIWAAGIRAPELNYRTGLELDSQGRIIVEKDLSIPGHGNAFVAGDQASFSHQTGSPLPCLSPVAIQQGEFIAKNIINDINGKKKKDFSYFDKGQMATIGRSRAIAEFGKFKMSGFPAWLAWLFVHIYFITGFNNRLMIFIKWMISYMTNKKGARIIYNQDWEFYTHKCRIADQSLHQMKKPENETQK